MCFHAYSVRLSPDTGFSEYPGRGAAAKTPQFTAQSLYAELNPLPASAFLSHCIFS